MSLLLKTNLFRPDRLTEFRRSLPGLVIVFAAIGFIVLNPPIIFGQASAPPTSPADKSSIPSAENKPADTAVNSAEISSHDQPATFKVNVKLVVVRAVIRDAQGHAVGNLQKDDFQIFDRGKPQLITQFEVERPGDLVAKARQTAAQDSTNALPGETPAAKDAGAAPERFIAYLFDDVHIEFGDLARVREAAQRHFQTLRPTDRAAIFTTSGQTMLDYTDDRAKLHDTLLRLLPRPIARISASSECPQISHYQGDLIVNKNDPQAQQVALQEALGCIPPVPGISQATLTSQAEGMVQMATQEAINSGGHESQVSLGVLRDVVRNISRKPGQRTVILVSPGFIAPQMEYDYMDTIDRAVRSQVVINALDARGLYVIMPFGDASTSLRTAPPPQKVLIETAAAEANDDLLATLADGTGGVFYHNNNDFDEGFRRIAEAPEFSYILAFTPQDLKLDGGFHSLRVTLRNGKKLSIQARRGYFAPKHAADPNEQAKQEIEEAMYSQEEIHNLPVKLHTQFFKASDDAAKLIVLAHVDVQHIRYKKADGRNNDVLTCVSAVFNRNGNFLQGMEKTVTMHWKDETLDRKLSPGITLKSSFDVKPGSYLVRLVVRDSEGQLMSAENGTVEIR